MKRLWLSAVIFCFAANALAVHTSGEQALSGPLDSHWPRMATAVWTGTEFAAFWHEGNDLRAARIGTDGRLLEPSRLVWTGIRSIQDPTTDLPWDLAAATDGSSIVVITATRRIGSSILARRFSFDLQPLGQISTVGFGSRPQIVFTGTQFFMTWLTGVPYGLKPSGDLILSIFDRSLRIVVQHELTTMPVPRVLRWTLATSGTDALIAWEDAVGLCPPSPEICFLGSRIRAARIAPDLAILDPGAIDISEEGYYT